MATRAATVNLPLGQIALLGMGALAVANPDKFLAALAKTSQVMMTTTDFDQRGGLSQQPIIIHHGSSSRGGGGTMTGTVVQLVCGAGLCWGSYMVLINVLPEAAKGMLPVTKIHFNKAVTSLGTAVLNLKDVLMEQVIGLSKKQDDLSDKQEETFVEVLNVKDNVSDLKGDLSLVQESLDLCHLTLSESERRTTYIAHGVQLLTRGVSTFLADNDDLMLELKQFNSVGEKYKPSVATPTKTSTSTSSPLQSSRKSIKKEEEEKHHASSSSLSTPMRPKMMLENSSAGPASPENDIPYNAYETPAKDVEHSLTELRNLLTSVRCGN